MADDRPLEDIQLEGIMNTSDGRAVLGRILARTGLGCDMFNADTHASAYNMGAQSVGIWLIDEMKQANPEMYIEMIKENIDG